MLTTSENKRANSNSTFCKTGIQFLILIFALIIIAGNIFAQSPISKSGKLYTESKPKHMELIRSSETHLPENWNEMFHQSAFIAIYDSVYSWDWDIVDSVWKFNGKTINIIYDSNNNLTSYTIQRWDSSSTWINWYLYTFTFDANNNMLSQLSQGWNGSAWENSSLFSSTYDINNNRTSELFQNWIGGIWMNSSLYTYMFDGSNNMTSYLSQDWDVNMWVNSSQYTYTYDLNNNQTNSLTQNWNGTSWDNRLQSTFIYDANNNRISRLTQLWNGITWENSYRITYTFDANNNQTNSLSQNWNLNVWENTSQSIITYDSNNNMTNLLSQLWNNNAWETTTTYINTYDHNNFQQSQVVISSVSMDSTYLYFHVITGVDELISDNERINVYPNPFDNQIKINSNGNKNEEVVLVDILGKEVLRSKIFIGETKISTEKLTPGFYVLKSSNGNKNSNVRLIKY